MKQIYCVVQRRTRSKCGSKPGPVAVEPASKQTPELRQPMVLLLLQRLPPLL